MDQDCGKGGRKILPYRSWNRIRNMGDAITPYILEAMFGFSPVFGAKEEPHLLATGSIYFLANSNSSFWGSGIQDPKNIKLPDISPEKIHAARGKLTVEFLRSKGFGLGDIPLGDPGIFAKEVLDFYGYAPEAERYRAAVVPHHTALDHPTYRKLAGSGEFCVIDVLDTSLDCLRKIAASDVVVSQSLHGLIFAESFGKPSVWIAHSNEEGWAFKFRDWHSTVSNPQAKPFPVHSDVERLLAAAEPRRHAIDKQALLDAFPRHLAQEQAVEPFNFKDCRSFDPVFARARVFDTAEILDCERVDRAAMDALRRRVATLRDQTFLGWSERPYLCLLCNQAEISVSRPTTEAIARYMDTHQRVEFASIISRRSAAAAGLQVEALGDGFGHVPERRLLGGGLFLRATTNWLPDNFATFVV